MTEPLAILQRAFLQHQGTLQMKREEYTDLLQAKRELEQEIIEEEVIVEALDHAVQTHMQPQPEPDPTDLAFEVTPEPGLSKAFNTYGSVVHYTVGDEND